MLEIKKGGKAITTGEDLSTADGHIKVDENVFWEYYNAGYEGW